MRQIRLKPWSRDFSTVSRLLKSQIPASELLPLITLRLGLAKKNLDCTVFYDGDHPAGFYYVEIGRKAVFLLYLVVNPDVQSRGYGTAMLRALRENYPGMQLDMHIEIPKDPSSPDEQAARRARFYERAGFRYTGWKTSDGGVDYWIMSSLGPGFDPEVHRQFLEKDRASGRVILEQDPLSGRDHSGNAREMNT